jgi:ribose transport system substrate-binding protein
MKRGLLFLLMCALLLTFVAGCNTKGSAETGQPTTQQGTTQSGGKKVVMTCAFYTAPFIAAFRTAAEEYTKTLGIELQIVDGERDTTKQLEQAKMAKAQADGFVYFPADIPGAASVLEELGDFPYVIVNNYSRDLLSESGATAFVGPELETCAAMMLEHVYTLFPDKKANIVRIAGTAGHNQTSIFTQEFEKAFNGTDLVFLDTQYADFDSDLAMTKMTDYITKYGDQIDLIIADDGGMTQGVIAAMKAAGIRGEIPIVSYGSNKILYDAIMSGDVYGVATQDPVAEAKLVLDVIVKIMNGEKVDQWIPLPVQAITKENADTVSWFE